jgi:hypothetical protein
MFQCRLKPPEHLNDLNRLLFFVRLAIELLTADSQAAEWSRVSVIRVEIQKANSYHLIPVQFNQQGSDSH